MQKSVKISLAPNSSNLENAGDLTIKISFPYSKDEVTVLLNPAIQYYKENQDQLGIDIRHTTLSTPTSDTRELMFDFKANNTHYAAVAGTDYKIKLMEIGTEQFEGHEFPTFEFFVETT